MRLTYKDLVDRLQRRKPTTFSRFGDGEFNCIFGDPKAPPNVDGHAYYPDLGKRLREILESTPNYFIGIQPMARHAFAPPHPNSKTFDALVAPYPTDADMLHRASIRRLLTFFFDVLRGRKVLIIGPPHLKDLKVFPFQFLPIPAKNCWLSYPSMLRAAQTWQCPLSVVLVCAGMPAKCLIHDLWKHNPQGTYIDCGSLLDPFAGVLSRTYHRKLRLS